ncbi:MAG: hypothetical protein M1460_03560 [Candidatus Thermoplasmatota archaeon]|nr:hypothetical protein [Candidatus Thermoplasmatota archaeon]
MQVLLICLSFVSEKAPLLGKRMSTGQSLRFNESMLTGMRETSRKPVPSGRGSWLIYLK